MLPEVDLLPKYERSESVLYNLFLIGFLLLVVFIIVLSYLYFNTSNQLQEVEREIETLNETKTVLETSIHRMETEPTATVEQAVTYVEQFTTPPSTLVDELVSLLPEQGYLSYLEYDYNTVEIHTQFETLPESSTYIADLLDSTYLEDVVIDEVNTITYADISGETGEIEERYDVIPRYDVIYRMDVDHEGIAGEEEENETAISGE